MSQKSSFLAFLKLLQLALCPWLHILHTFWQIKRSDETISMKWSLKSQVFWILRNSLAWNWGLYFSFWTHFLGKLKDLVKRFPSNDLSKVKFFWLFRSSTAWHGDPNLKFWPHFFGKLKDLLKRFPSNDLLKVKFLCFSTFSEAPPPGVGPKLHVLDTLFWQIERSGETISIKWSLKSQVFLLFRSRQALGPQLHVLKIFLAN